MQILICEWPGFALCTSSDRNPVEERTGVHVQKLPEQVLVHESRRDLVPAKCKLQAAVKRDRIRSKPQNRIDSTVADCVVRIAILNHSNTWKQQSARREALPHKSRDYREISHLHSVMRLDQILERVAWWWQQCRIGHIQNPRIQRIDVDVLKRRSEYALRNNAYFLIDLAAFLFGLNVLRTLGHSAIFGARDRRCLRE